MESILKKINGRRCNERIEIDITAKIIDTSQDIQLQDVLLENICSNGALIWTNRELLVGESLTVAVDSFPDENSCSIQLELKVGRILDKKKADNFGYGCSIISHSEK